MNDLKKIGENEKTIFYTNMLTEDFGDGFKIILAKMKKTGEMNYLLLKDGEIIKDSKTIEDLWFKREVLKKLDERN